MNGIPGAVPDTAKTLAPAATPADMLPTAPASRADELDALLGDPWDDTNPVGYRAVLAADERAQMHADGERALDAFGLNAEYVPGSHGGRLIRADHLAEVLRTVWRRDPCLGLGHGFSSFIAAVNLWSAGGHAQQRTAANVLLGHGRIAVAYHELAHGNDLGHTGFRADPAAGASWLLNGRKEIIANFRRAEALVVFARTRAGRGSRCHSQFLVESRAVPSGRLRYLGRFPTSGMRGLQLGGGEFTDCPVPSAALVGEPGQGIETALRSFQVTRAVFASLCVGPLDTALRAVLGFAQDRALYGGTVADLPYVRYALGAAYADLLAMDAFSTVAVRALHELPGQSALIAAAAKCLVSRMLVDAFADLRGVLGAQSYLREGRYGVFQKLARDVQVATFAHASRSVCLTGLLPQLPRLARRSWFTDPPAPARLFRLGEPLPDLDFGSLAVGAPRTDSLAQTLADLAGWPGWDGPAGRLAEQFRGELLILRAECAALAPQDLVIGASPAAYALAERYTVVLAAAAVLGVWRSGCLNPRPGGPGDAALTAMLDRLAGRLGLPAVISDAERAQAREQLLLSAVDRRERSQLFDLTARRIPG